MPVPVPNLNQLQINPPQPATAMLKAMEYNRQREETDLRKDYLRLAKDQFAQQMLQFQKNFNLREEEFDAINMFKSLDFAAKNTINKEEFNKTVKELTGKNTDIEFHGNTITSTIEGPDGKQYKVTGKQEMILDFAAKVAEDPTWITDPVKAEKARAYMAKNGLTIKSVESSELKEYEEKKKIDRKYKDKKAPTVAEIQAKIVDDVINKGKPISELTPEEKKLLDKATDKAATLIDTLIAAGVGSQSSANLIPTIKFDEKGELIVPEENVEIGDNGQTIIRKKIPEQ